MPSSARTNNSTNCTIQPNIIATGTFKLVKAGIYITGPRAGEACIAKSFLPGFAAELEKQYFDQELSVVAHTQEIVDKFNAAGILDAGCLSQGRGVFDSSERKVMDTGKGSGKKILLNTPEIWFSQEHSGKSYLVEPMIKGFEKWNSNSGWAATGGGVWNEAMQALSHFSYHESGGKFLLCDIQGGAYKDGYVLTDPVIMSHTPLACGPTDLGKDGIDNFFVFHTCGRFCKKTWDKPGGNVVMKDKAAFEVKMGTTMVPWLETRGSREALTWRG